MDDLPLETDVPLSDDGSGTPTKKQLLEMLDSAEVSDDMKDKLRALLTGGAPKLFGTSSSTGTILAIVFTIVIFSVILFFGYKLYKSIKEKETKREEKKKAKQMKKKK